MKCIYDCKGRLVCKVDPDTGFIESKYQKLTMRTTLPLRTSLVIEREKVWTKIPRVDNQHFYVESKVLS